MQELGICAFQTSEGCLYGLPSDTHTAHDFCRIPSSSASALEQCGPLLQRGPVSGKPAAAIIDSNISAFCEVTG